MNDSKNERGETANSVRDRLAPWLVNVALLLMALELGGSLYERLVVDPAWPTNPAIVQPDSGGVNRKVFWIPLHGALTLLLPIALWPVGAAGRLVDGSSPQLGSTWRCACGRSPTSCRLLSSSRPRKNSRIPSRKTRKRGCC